MPRQNLRATPAYPARDTRSAAKASDGGYFLVTKLSTTEDTDKAEKRLSEESSATSAHSAVALSLDALRQPAFAGRRCIISHTLHALFETDRPADKSM